ncbi:MAG TPA: cytochrome P460 family protein, partial [Polyangiaceae bacterium]
MFSVRPRLAWALGAAVAAFAVMQLSSPKVDNPPVHANLQAPSAVAAVLRRACYDCHSNETRLLWFDRIAPATWLVARDVRSGRAHLNFSEAGAWPAPKQKAALFESVNHILLGAMPSPAYLALHPSARISDAELALLKNYLAPADAPLPPLRTKVAPDAAQPTAPVAVLPTKNGIGFPPDYTEWQAISATERFDNESLRVILGNATALTAIDGDRVEPWPDGTAFAKLAWKAKRGVDGELYPDEFWQVEFMFKDRARYASTHGWGFARWRGTMLAPYGDNPDFAEECVGCHTPVAKTDYVFTSPISGARGNSMLLNRSAALPDAVLALARELRPMAPFISPSRGSLELLSGNALARRHRAEQTTQAYPVGSVLSLVTWSRADDPRWFGARVPGATQ